MGDLVVTLLERKYRGSDRNLMEWLEPMVAEVAGMMRLDEAVPVLVERLHEDDLNLPNSCWIALSTIANDRVVETIADHWKNGDERFRSHGKDFDCLEDDDGTIFKSIPMSDEMGEIIAEQKQHFIEEFGREPGPGDKNCCVDSGMMSLPGYCSTSTTQSRVRRNSKKQVSPSTAYGWRTGNERSQSWRRRRSISESWMNRRKKWLVGCKTRKARVPSFWSVVWEDEEDER